MAFYVSPAWELLDDTMSYYQIRITKTNNRGITTSLSAGGRTLVKALEELKKTVQKVKL
jgi:hypothetical protein